MKKDRPRRPTPDDVVTFQRAAMQHPRGSPGRALHSMWANILGKALSFAGKPRRGRPKGTTGATIDDSALLARMAEIAESEGELPARTLAKRALAETPQPTTTTQKQNVERLALRYKSRTGK